MTPDVAARLKRGSILIVVGLAIALFDLWLYASPPPDDTISERGLSFAGDHPIIMFEFGIIIGHMFWPQRRRIKP